MKDKIKLGDKVECMISGFKGIAVARTEFLNGCIQYIVACRISKDSKMPEEMSIDFQSLKVIKKSPKDFNKYSDEEDEEETGGATRIAPRQRGY